MHACMNVYMHVYMHVCISEGLTPARGSALMPTAAHTSLRGGQSGIRVNTSRLGLTRQVTIRGQSAQRMNKIPNLGSFWPG